MDTIKFLAEISREFFRIHKVYKFKMKKVSEMSDKDIITFCHHFVEDNRLNDEWYNFREEKEAEYSDKL